MKKTWMRSFSNDPIKETELMERIIPDPIRIFDMRKQCFIWLPWVGSYGTFSNPIVDYNGTEVVCDYKHIPTNQSACQSRGCDFCTLDGYTGCTRYIDESECAYCI